MGKLFVGALWGSMLVLCIWCLTVISIESDSALPVLSVFGLIFCGFGLAAFVIKMIIDNWD